MGCCVGFAGLSHLGIVSSIATAAKGFGVIAYDNNSELVGSLENLNLPVHEPQLDDLLRNNKKNIRFVDQAAELANCSVVVVAIDIATNANNESDFTGLNSIIDTILPSLAENSTLVVLSQVKPGYTRDLSRRIHDQLSAKNIKLYYQVETLVFGRAVERALYPERYIVGCADPDVALPNDYEIMLSAFQCPILPMRYESAELTKIAINIFLTSTVTATNTLAEICENIGANWHEMVPALQLDKRIGKYAYLAPGLGIAGGNLERDLVTINTLAREHGADDRLIHAFRGNSIYRRDWSLRLTHESLQGLSNPVVGVWGLAYKQNTHSTKNSPALAYVQSLRGLTVNAYDPQVKLSSVDGVNFQLCETALRACGGADILAIVTPWPEFGEIDLKHVLAQMRRKVIIDPYGCVNSKAAKDLGFDYHRLGYSPKERILAA